MPEQPADSRADVGSAVEPTVRQATLNDRDAIWEFTKAAYGDLAQYKIPQRWNWQFWDNPFVDQREEKLPVWIAVKDGRIVGQTCGSQVVIKIGDRIEQGAWGGNSVGGWRALLQQARV